MNGTLALAAFVCGAGVSLVSSWVLVVRLERVGERWGLSEALLGMLAAFAADAPEITSAVTAVSHHQRVVGAGIIVGSNVFNLAALLGLGAVVAGRIGLHRRVIELGGAVALWVAFVSLLSVLGVLAAGAGLGLVLAVLVPYVVVLGARRSRLSRLPIPRGWLRWLGSAIDEEELEIAAAIRPRRATRRDSFIAAASLGVVVIASVAMERGASVLGHRYGVADLVVGGLVLAAVTSLPNAVAAVYLARKQRGAAALSTALNSNTINVVAGLLVPAVVVGLARPSAQQVLIVGCYVGLTGLVLGLAYAGRGLGRFAGWLIVSTYGLFVIAVVAVS